MWECYCYCHCIYHCFFHSYCHCHCLQLILLFLMLRQLLLIQLFTLLLELPLILEMMSSLLVTSFFQTICSFNSHSFRANIIFCYYSDVILFSSAAATLTLVVHSSTSVFRLAYFNDCFLKDIDRNVPSTAMTDKSFPIFTLSILLYLLCAFCQ